MNLRLSRRGFLTATVGLCSVPNLGRAAAAYPAQDLSWLSGITREHKPFMALTHCLCEVPLGGK